MKREKNKKRKIKRRKCEQKKKICFQQKIMLQADKLNKREENYLLSTIYNKRARIDIKVFLGRKLSPEKELKFQKLS